MLGHVGKDSTIKTAEVYSWVLTGKWENCDHCGIAKARQSNISKNPVERSKTPGKRLSMDISSIKSISYKQAKFWLLALDNCTNHEWSYYLKKKSNVCDNMLALIKDLKSKQIVTVKYIHCDDAGKHKMLEEACLKAGLRIQFEYMALGMPQRMGVLNKSLRHYTAVSMRLWILWDCPTN